jgi:tRNA G18 (ribose-2'-O)-methylase SpoU
MFALLHIGGGKKSYKKRTNKENIFIDKVLVLGREKEGIPVDIIHVLDACVEIPQLGIVRSLNVHVSGAIAVWEYTRQQRIAT